MFRAVCSHVRRPTWFPGARRVSRAGGGHRCLASESPRSSCGWFCSKHTGQLAGGTRQLTIDASGLRFADSASIRALVLAARTLQGQGGSLVLLRPQPPVARMLELIGADQVITVRGISTATP